MSRTNNDTLIVAPVSVHDVAKVIHRGSLDVGVLCTAKDYINKWAKYKPVRYNALDTTGQLNSDTAKTWNDNVTKPWWRDNDGMCGLTVNIYKTGATLVSGWNNNWLYNTPRGSSVTPNEPYRLIDFNRYEHDKDYNPVACYLMAQYDVEQGCYVYYINQGNSVGIHFSLRADKEYQLKLTDFLNTGKGGLWSNNDKMYCGVLVTWGNDNYSSANKLCLTNPNELGKDMTASDEGSGMWERSVTIPSAKLPTLANNANIRLYPFIAATVYNTSTPSTTDVTWEKGVVPAPIDASGFSVKPMEVRIVGSFTACTCKKSNSGGAYIVTFTFKIRNLTNGTFTFNGQPKIFICDSKPDTSGTVAWEDKFQGYPIISNIVTGASMGITVQPDNSVEFDQYQLTHGGASGQTPLTIGAEITTYNPVRVCLLLEGASNPNAGQVNYLVDVTV